MDENGLSRQIIGAAIEVHRHLGPGLLERAYQLAMMAEMDMRGLQFECEKSMPVFYKGKELEAGFRLDFLVEGLVVVELKTVDAILPVHEAQVLTYLKITGCKLGLLLNFNVAQMKEGIRRLVHELPEPQPLYNRKIR